VPRQAGMEEPFVGLAPDLLSGITATKLHAALIRVLTPKLQPRVDLDHVAPVRASVQDAVDELLVELPRLRTATFRSLTAGIAEKLAVIVRFLAILELYKQGAVELEQATTFGELSVVWLDAADRDVMPVEEYSG
jgi:segregation and condensation protein A